MSKDYYKILGIKKNASKEDIKKAYKKLAKKYHPDISKEENASEKFKEVNEAAAILGDPQKREQYDRFGSTGPQGGYDFSGFDFSSFNFDDIFDNFFSGFGFGGGGRRQQSRGRDMEYEVELTLQEVARGVTKKISFKTLAMCKHCHGKGSESGNVESCSTCHGRGRVVRQQRTPFGVMQTQTVCPHCRGEGQTITDPCHECDGSGRTKQKITLHVDIPAGVENGMKVRVPEKGEAGLRGGTPGDLFVVVYVLPEETFTRQGDDIYVEVPLDFVTATLGGKIEVPTLEGKATLKIPAGTQSETIFNMKEKGIPNVHGRGIGSEKVKVSISVPKKLNKKQKELLEQFGKSGKKKGWLFG